MILSRLCECGGVSELPVADLPRLCAELRSELLEKVPVSGGHLASNLGVVEATVALHRVLDTARDRLVFDVGHQAYVHKMLTGRLDRLDTLRALGGLSGFPRPSESSHDAFIAGHASTAVSVALGMARARTLSGNTYHVAAFLGDGALTGGLVYEALSDAGRSGESLLVVLNDNGMSINRSEGAIARYLTRLRLKPRYFRFKRAYLNLTTRLPGGAFLQSVTRRIKDAVKDVFLPDTLFEALGFDYLGPTDGHDAAGLTEVFRYALTLGRPVVVHIVTVKGKGHQPSESDPTAYHSVDGKLWKGARPKALRLAARARESDSSGNVCGGRTYSEVFGNTLCDLARRDRRICAVTAAMREGTGLEPFFQEFPERAIDVGIAEGHAVTMAAGLCQQGFRPVVAIYSTFLQRAYDMILHDVALSGLPVVFAVDRAGLIGGDGETHQGLYDLGFLSTVPGVSVCAPASFGELSSMLRGSLKQSNGPMAIRYPKGGEETVDGWWPAELSEGTAPRRLREGENVTFLTHGALVPVCLASARKLEAEGVSADVWQARLLTGEDWENVLVSADRSGCLVVAEEVSPEGSVGRRILANAAERGLVPRRFVHCHAGNRFVPQGTVAEQRRLLGLDTDGICSTVRSLGLSVVRKG